MKYSLKLKGSIIISLVLIFIVALCGAINFGNAMPKQIINSPILDAVGGVILMCIGIVGFISVMCVIDYSAVSLKNTDKAFDAEVEKRVREKVDKLIQELQKESK
jgi:hypothetical protein